MCRSMQTWTSWLLVGLFVLAVGASMLTVRGDVPCPDTVPSWSDCTRCPTDKQACKFLSMAACPTTKGREQDNLYYTLSSMLRAGGRTRPRMMSSAAGIAIACGTLSRLPRSASVKRAPAPS